MGVRCSKGGKVHENKSKKVHPSEFHQKFEGKNLPSPNQGHKHECDCRSKSSEIMKSDHLSPVDPADSSSSPQRLGLVQKKQLLSEYYMLRSHYLDAKTTLEIMKKYNGEVPIQNIEHPGEFIYEVITYFRDLNILDSPNLKHDGMLSHNYNDFTFVVFQYFFYRMAECVKHYKDINSDDMQSIYMFFCEYEKLHCVYREKSENNDKSIEDKDDLNVSKFYSYTLNLIDYNSVFVESKAISDDLFIKELPKEHLTEFKRAVEIVKEILGQNEVENAIKTLFSILSKDNNDFNSIYGELKNFDQITKWMKSKALNGILTLKSKIYLSFESYEEHYNENEKYEVPDPKYTYSLLYLVYVITHELGHYFVYLINKNPFAGTPDLEESTKQKKLTKDEKEIVLKFQGYEGGYLLQGILYGIPKFLNYSVNCFDSTDIAWKALNPSSYKNLPLFDESFKGIRKFVERNLKLSGALINPKFGKKLKTRM